MTAREFLKKFKGRFDYHENGADFSVDMGRILDDYANIKVTKTLEKVKMHIPIEAIERVMKELKQ